jgi:hypothetical protein
MPPRKMVMINDFYKKPKSKFWEGYARFKNWHTTKWNIFFHFLTSIIQFYFFYLFLFTFNFYYILGMILIPYITDGIGHLCEKNLRIVLIMSKLTKSSNSAGINPFFNFLYKIILGLEKTYKTILK